MLGLVVFAAACVPVLTTPEGLEPYLWEMPSNQWPVREPPDDLQPEGWDLGQVPPDFRLLDQHGDIVSLWQFYGTVVVLDVSTIWCGPCQDLAEHVQETQDDYAARGMVYLTMLPEDLDENVPDQSDLQLWADGFGIAAPVLSDDAGHGLDISPGEQWPHIVVIDRAMTVAVERVVPAEDAVIRQAVEDLL